MRERPSFGVDLPDEVRTEAQACGRDTTMSRRIMLGAAAAVCASATFVAPIRATAQQKVKQADAKYQTSPKGNAKCGACMQFQAPNACKLVEGEINPEGWCILYTPKAHS